MLFHASWSCRSRTYRGVACSVDEVVGVARRLDRGISSYKRRLDCRALDDRVAGVDGQHELLHRRSVVRGGKHVEWIGRTAVVGHVGHQGLPVAGGARTVVPE